jgi:hypothetical protein
MHWFYDQNMMGFPWFQLGILPTMIWSSVWKGLALWHASKRDEKWWFIALLVINTVGILEMCYLLFVVRLFAGKTPTKSTKKKRT